MRRTLVYSSETESELKIHSPVSYVDPIVNSYARSQDYALALSHLLRAQDALKSSGSTTGSKILCTKPLPIFPALAQNLAYVVPNLCHQYAHTQLFGQNPKKSARNYLASLDVVEEVKALREVADSPDPPPDNLPPPKLTLPFSTAIAR
eukprot:1374642-Amorphochlora_amoeboformis.AAC.1